MTSPRDAAVSMPGGPASTARDLVFEDFVAVSSSRLSTLALLVCGGHHRAEAEDLLQSMLERAYRRWGRICRDGDPERYVGRMIVNASVDRWRRLRRRPETPVTSLEAGRAAADQCGTVADRTRYTMRSGETGVTFVSCRNYKQLAGTPGLTDYYGGFLVLGRRCVPVQAWLPGSRDPVTIGLGACTRR